MKKLTFILFALIAGTTFAQNGATHFGTAEVFAEIIQPIEIEKTNDLQFGRIIGNAAGGTVKVSTDGRRTADDNEDLLDPSSNGSAASFKVTAASGYTYDITLDGSELSGAGGAAMPVQYSHDGNGQIGIGGSEFINVGGELTVGTTQGQGDYTGTVKVTVTYN